MHYLSLYAYHLTYFLVIGASSFLSKLYGELGMSNSQIGVLSSLPTVFSLILVPMLGAMSDRVSKKRYILSVMLLLMALSCVIGSFSSGFWGLFIAASLFTVFSNAPRSVAASISLEYTRQIGKEYGPIRLFGTVGYQLGALLVGALLTYSLKNLYPLLAVSSVVAVGSTLMMPDVRGHQHSKRKVPFSRLFADGHLRWLYGFILLSTVSYQFHVSFFNKYLGDLGMSNSVVSWITVLGVMAELPFLFFGDKIAKKTNIWNWLMIGGVICGLRWIGQAFTTNTVLLILLQLPGVVILACYDFFPAIYLNRKVSGEQLGAAQSLLTLTTFGASRVIGGMLGGWICEYVSIPTMFFVHGVLLLLGCALLWKPTRQLIKEETVLNLT